MAQSSFPPENRSLDYVLRKRVRKLACACLVAFGAITVALAYWQVIRAPNLREDMRNPRFDERNAADSPEGISSGAPEDTNGPQASAHSAMPAVSSRITCDNSIKAIGLASNDYLQRRGLRRQYTRSTLALPHALS